MGELDNLFGELDQLASPRTCFYRKISTETPIETKQKDFLSELKRERKGGALGGSSNCPTRQIGELDGSRSLNGRVGWFARSNLSFDVKLNFRKVIPQTVMFMSSNEDEP
ncbi:hypothetical protein F2Q69_00048244 [Brassica cretica]|uniref:Uncharacterized protein n=1 Tax=Brassica cretica TaxID=69181 RepID=A0A8S9PHU7_BRACR|nr:hypothetical protein F2Q69_00048244 [Brassica cretica]